MPPQCLGNKMTVATIPNCIKILDMLELSLLARIKPYMKIFKLPGMYKFVRLANQRKYSSKQFCGTVVY